MKKPRFVYALFVAALATFGAASARAQGTTPLALVQQYDKSGNGQPLSSCFLYFYVAGTVATLTQVYQDYGLTLTAPNPLACDASGRVPMHWVATGPVHVRLTDSSGLVQLDTTLQSIGPSSGGGAAGGPAIDPNAVAQTGDMKARFDDTDLRAFGWVKLNGTTIGPPASGATQFASNQAQNLFVYLWQNCPDAHCPVIGGRGATAQADWVSGSKAITLPDMRSKAFVGRDCMGAGCAGLLLGSNITSGGVDGVDTLGAGGGAANQTAITTLQKTNLPNVTFDIPAGQGSHNHGVSWSTAYVGAGTFPTFSSGGNISPFPDQAYNMASTNPLTINSNTLPYIYALSGGTGAAATSQPFANMPPFLLVTYYMKL